MHKVSSLQRHEADPVLLGDTGKGVSPLDHIGLGRLWNLDDLAGVDPVGIGDSELPSGVLRVAVKRLVAGVNGDLARFGASRVGCGDADARRGRDGGDDHHRRGVSQFGAHSVSFGALTVYIGAGEAGEGRGII